MIKNKLREMKFFVEFREAKHSAVNFIWVLLTFAIIFLSSFYIFEISSNISRFDIFDPFESITNALDELFGAGYVLIYLIFGVFLYLFMKFVMTILFCSDKFYSIRLKMLEGKGLPVCSCKEALKFWQMSLIYLVPVILMYTLMFLLCAYSKANAVYMLILFFLSFFMAFDLTVVVYMFFWKIKDRMDYISVDSHVYQMTLFKKTYIKTTPKPIKMLSFK
jgi:hypothetical protein